jgi:hypothetical protein
VFLGRTCAPAAGVTERHLFNNSCGQASSINLDARILQVESLRRIVRFYERMRNFSPPLLKAHGRHRQHLHMNHEVTFERSGFTTVKYSDAVVGTCLLRTSLKLALHGNTKYQCYLFVFSRWRTYGYSRGKDCCGQRRRPPLQQDVALAVRRKWHKSAR